jgi:neutral ceramidase
MRGSDDSGGDLAAEIGVGHRDGCTATLLGTATADITPRTPVELSGFASRSGPFTGVRAPLAAQVFAFGDEERVRAVLVCADLLWWGPDLYETVAAQIHERHGIDRTAIVLHASHTHCGPMPGATFSPMIGAADPAYLDVLAERIVDVTGRALQHLEPVTIARSTGECHFGISRRRLHPDGRVGGPDPDGPRDTEVTVLRFGRLDGSTKAVLVHYTCHPVTSDAPLVSPDFPGAMRDQLAASLDVGVVGFLQGCCGDQDPTFDGTTFRRGDDAEIHALGAQLADAVRTAMTGALTTFEPGTAEVRTMLRPLPLDTPTHDDLAAASREPGIGADWARTLRSAPGRLTAELPVRLTLLRITDGLALLGFDAEVTVAYGHYVKQRGALPIPYTNGMIGYVVTADQLAQGGYEPDGSYPYVYRPGRWQPAVEQRLKVAIDEILGHEPQARGEAHGPPTAVR